LPLFTTQSFQPPKQFQETLTFRARFTNSLWQYKPLFWCQYLLKTGSEKLALTMHIRLFLRLILLQPDQIGTEGRQGL